MYPKSRKKKRGRTKLLAHTSKASAGRIWITKMNRILTEKKQIIFILFITFTPANETTNMDTHNQYTHFAIEPKTKRKKQITQKRQSIRKAF